LGWYSTITQGHIMKSLFAALPLLAALAPAQAATVAPYDHIFVLMEENHEYDQIIGNTNAPNINSWAKTYGLATNYFAVTHPSAPNYVALTGGSYFGIQDDNDWQTHKLNDPSITSQIDAVKTLSWKSYFQTMPKKGFTGDCYPSSCLYASKHNGPIYFDSVNESKKELKKETPITQLTTDLATGKLPSWAFIVPDICHDMHGGVGDCTNSTDAELVAAGDTYAAGIYQQITTAPFWTQGNNMLVVVWDEGSTNNGGGGQVAAIIITNNGVRGVQDNTQYSHYSLLGSIEAALGLGCLQNTCTATLMSTLFAHN
jgi:phospholipase C